MHARLTLEYDGTPFRGWSRQPGSPTIEGELLTAAARIGLDKVSLRCAARTDAGVHAAAQVVRIDYEGPVPVERLAPALNQRLPAQIAVLESRDCPADFDPRGEALARAYAYRVLNRRAPSPLRAERVLHHPRHLDLAALEAAAAALLGQHDFTAFTPTRTRHTFFHRTIIEAAWRAEGDELVFSIAGNAFLRNMVRIVVGSMLAIGRGEFTIGELQELLRGAPRSDAHNTAPPHALCLLSVTFPEEQPLTPAPSLA